MAATVEDVHSDHTGHSDHEHGDPGEGSLEKIQSRAERKARKALQGMGLRRIPNINRVTLRRSKTVLLVVAQPDVYKSHNSDCYVIFGEAKVDDSGQAALGAHLAQQSAAAAAAAESHVEEDEGDVPPLEPVEDDEAVDETGLDPKEIETVMTQTECTRAKAVQALKASGGDLVNAIMAASG
ncbi:GAL4 enhancer protein [Tulasnella sp. 403]|nr:GAL4 enhancer protein [Tulasnella sp. 403]